MSRNWDQSKRSSVRQRRTENQFTSRIWWTSVTWRTPNLQSTSRSTNRRVVLRGDNVKDEEGYRAVFRRARCINVSYGSRRRLWTLSQSFRGMVGETSDAIPTYTQVQKTEAPRMLRSVTHWNQTGDKMFAKIDQLSNQKLQAIRSCVKTDWRLQIWFIPRCFTCIWFARFKISVRIITVRTLITHVCSRCAVVQSLKLFR